VDRILTISTDTFLATVVTYIAQYTTGHPGSQQKDGVNNYYSTAQCSIINKISIVTNYSVRNNIEHSCTGYSDCAKG
jgi:hypothetical protein